MYYLTRFLSLLLLAGFACSQPKDTSEIITADSTASKFANAPLVEHIYTADPSAHVFEGKIFIYPSHDIETEVAEDDMGSHF